MTNTTAHSRGRKKFNSVLRPKISPLFERKTIGCNPMIIKQKDVKAMIKISNGNPRIARRVEILLKKLQEEGVLVKKSERVSDTVSVNTDLSELLTEPRIFIPKIRQAARKKQK